MGFLFYYLSVFYCNSSKTLFSLGYFIPIPTAGSVKRFHIFNFQKNSRAPNIKMSLKGNLSWFESLGIEGTKPKWRALSNYKWLNLILILTYFLILIDIHIYTNIPFILQSFNTTLNLPRSSSLPSCLQLPLPRPRGVSLFYSPTDMIGMHYRHAPDVRDLPRCILRMCTRTGFSTFQHGMCWRTFFSLSLFQPVSISNTILTSIRS